MNESHLAPDDLLPPVAPEIADPGELVAVPGLPHGLWVKPLGRGKGRIETIAFEPTPYQFGDVIDYDGPVGERRLKGLSATGGFETVWFDFSPERGASARENLIQGLLPNFVRYDQDEDRVALVIESHEYRSLLKQLRALEAKGWGKIVATSRRKWPLSRSGRALGILSLACLASPAILLLPLFSQINNDLGLSILITVFFLYPMGLTLAGFLLFDTSRAPGRKALWLLLFLLHIPLLIYVLQPR